MAIIKCPECDGKVSSTAKTCPHCGHSMTFGRKGAESAKDFFGAIWNIMILLFALALLLGMCSAIIG